MKNKYKELILESLYNANIINAELYEKCGKPDYIQNLPGDLRTTNQEVLGERLDALQKLEDENEAEFNKKYEDYEKAKETEKKEADKIKKLTETIVDTIDDVYNETENLGRDYLSYETTEYYDEDEGEYYTEEDYDLQQSYYEFYDTLEELHNEIRRFQTGINDRLNGENEYSAPYTRVENLIDWTVYALDEGPGVYLNPSITNNMKNIQKLYINELNTQAQWDKWENAHSNVRDIEKDLVNLREKRDIIFSEIDATMRKLD